MAEEQILNQENATENLTPEEQLQYNEWLEKVGGFPQEEIKPGIHQIFNKIIKEDDSNKQVFDTIKTSALNENELDAFRHVRKGSIFFKLLGADIMAQFFKEEGEVILSSALSCSKRKGGAFLQALTTTRKEFTGKIGGGDKKGGLFSGKKESE